MRCRGGCAVTPSALVAQALGCLLRGLCSHGASNLTAAWCTCRTSLWRTVPGVPGEDAHEHSAGEREDDDTGGGPVGHRSRYRTAHCCRPSLAWCVEVGEGHQGRCGQEWQGTWPTEDLGGDPGTAPEDGCEHDGYHDDAQSDLLEFSATAATATRRWHGQRVSPQCARAGANQAKSKQPSTCPGVHAATCLHLLSVRERELVLSPWPGRFGASLRATSAGRSTGPAVATSASERRTVRLVTPLSTASSTS